MIFDTITVLFVEMHYSKPDPAPGKAGFSQFDTAVASGAAGGIFSDLQGGQFGHGFISAGLSSGIDGDFSDNVALQVLTSAVVAGTVSALSGGKFGNGAGSAAFAAALRVDWGDAGVGSGTKSPLSQEEFKNNKAELDKALKQLTTDGTLNTSKPFASEDDAAKEVLELVAPLSKKYGIELGGSIVKNGKVYHYSNPIIGSPVGVNIDKNWTGYHTHPDGDAFFSNNVNMAGTGNDVNWANVAGRRSYNNGLYLGVQLSTGHVAISVCAPMACSNIRRFGAIGRSLQ